MSDVHHSFENLPTSDSNIVLQERNEIIDAVQLSWLADKLKQVQIIARLALDAASGSGDADLYIQVGELQTQIKDVYGDCALAASQFTQATASVVNNLKFAFDKLLQAQQEVAMDIFSDSYYVARQAQEKAEKLAEDIKKEAEAEQIEKVIKKKQKKQQDAEKAKKHKEEELDRFLFMTADYMRHGALIIDLKEQYESAATEVKEMLNKRAKILVGFWSTFFPSAGPTESGIERAENRRRQKYETLEKAREAQKTLGNTVLEQLTKMNENNDNWEEIIKGVTIKRLENVSQGLAETSSTLGETAAFWYKIAQRCEYLSMDKTTDKLKIMREKVSEEKRKEYYTMATFQNKLIKYYAQWLALHGVSFNFGLQIHITQRDRKTTQ